jgi:hypothetical protein
LNATIPAASSRSVAYPRCSDWLSANSASSRAPTALYFGANSACPFSIRQLERVERRAQLLLDGDAAGDPPHDPGRRDEQLLDLLAEAVLRALAVRREDDAVTTAQAEDERHLRRRGEVGPIRRDGGRSS